MRTARCCDRWRSLRSCSAAAWAGELTEAAIALARDRRLPVLYLLTTTAEAYFPRFGFERIERDEVPAGVQASVEFTSVCPASATAMRKPLE